VLSFGDLVTTDRSR